MKRKKYLVLIIYMQAIDTGDANIENIAGKIQMIKALLETLKKEQGSNQREIMRIQVRLNNYNNKYDQWIGSLFKINC